MAIDFDELEIAVEFVSSGFEFGDTAYLDKLSGKIYYDADASDEVMPDDMADDNYIEIPAKKELGLGKSLAIKFAEQHLPAELDMVYTYFNSRGAYSNFKALLANRNLLDEWYSFEQAALRKAILDWCTDNDISI